MLADRRIKTSLFAIGADLLLTGIKTGLALLTGSAALLADAYHSGTDLFVSLVLLGSLVLRYRQERNNNSTEGARKLECVLAIAVSLIILYVPLEILSELDSRSRETLNHLWLGIGGTLVVIAIVYVMARLKTHVGRETDSPALEADGYHSKIDLFSSIAVLVSLIGGLVGIYLDEIVAVVIAVLIGIAGLELLASGIRSLLRGDDLDALSLFDSLALAASKIPFSRPLRAAGHWITRIYRRGRWLALPVLVLTWLASGWASVPYGYAGIHQRLGAPREQSLAPGLHYLLPWPIDTLTLIPKGRVLTATVGSRVTLDEAERDDKLWREIKATRAHEDQTLYLATGDENLLDIQFTLQYRIKNPELLFVQFQDLEALIKRYSESALWQETAQRSFDEILADSHRGFADAVAARISRELNQLGLAITVVDAQLQSLQPPAMVVSVYRDVLNASQEKQQQRNRAEAQRTHELLLANAERIRQQANIESDARERKMLAEGETERFNLLAQTYGAHGPAMEFNLYLQTLLNNLAGRQLLINDPNIDIQDRRLWGQEGMIHLMGTTKP